MKRLIPIFVALILLTIGCSPESGSDQGKPADPGSQNNQPQVSETEKRCGDGVCDGPENAANCAADCDVVENAAWVATARVILNLDEFIVRE